MAALLVALSIMAVAMSVAMPVWKQMSQREKEMELVFRGQQYVRAIGLYQRKTGPTLPPNIDVLVEQHFLRKKFKDPITGEDFLLIPGAMAQGGQPGQVGGTIIQPPGGRGASPATGTGRGTQPSPYIAQGGPFGTTVPGGVTGVVSKSTDASIRQYNGRGHYNEWEFRFVAPPPAQQAGPEGGGPTGRGGTGGPTGRGERGTTFDPTGRGGRGGGPTGPVSVPPPGGRGGGPGGFGGPPTGAPPGGPGGRAPFPGGR